MDSRMVIACSCAMLTVTVCADVPSSPQAFGQTSEERKVGNPTFAGFAYDPEKEEGPHPDSDFEWWYHFGFLKQKATQEFQYSFVSSFQRNKAGRYLFYNLSDLKTGKNYHYALVDRSLLGLADVQESSRVQGDRAVSQSKAAGIGRQLVRWLQDSLPLLPEGHEFMTPLVRSSESPDLVPWLCYGDNRFQKKEDSYWALYHNQHFVLDLTLRKQGPAMPVLGTGLTGLSKPEDQHYYTYPRMSALGHLRKDGHDTGVEGEFWYDHQWGKVTSGTLMKWCWWGLRLDNGQNLSIFFLQNARTGKTVQKGFTLHHPDGKTEVGKELTFAPKRSWNSRHGRTYSVEWEIKSRELGLTVQTRPFTDDHEVPVLLYKQIWEGPCQADVDYQDGRKAKGIGFQEMIGQDHE